MKVMYFMHTDGGMDVIDSLTAEDCNRRCFYGWDDPDWKEDDDGLLAFIASPRLGAVYHHRLGVAVVTLNGAE